MSDKLKVMQTPTRHLELSDKEMKELAEFLNLVYDSGILYIVEGQKMTLIEDAGHDRGVLLNILDKINTVGYVAE